MGCVCLLSCLSPQEAKQYFCGSKLGIQETSPSQSQSPKMSKKKKKKKMPCGCCSFSCFSTQEKRCYHCFGSKPAAQETLMEEKDQTQPTRSSKKKKLCGCCGLFSPQKVKQYCWGSKLVEQETYQSSSPKAKKMNINCGCCLLPRFPCIAPKQFFRGSKTPTRETMPSANTTKIEAKQLTFRRLAAMTKNFRQECLIGEGGLGRVYKGAWNKSGKVVAVKLLDRTLGLQSKEEFVSEVLVLSHLKHKNLVDLVGFCAHGDQRLLVYEYMEMGPLENHLHGDVPENKKDLDWLTRMKIAYGVSKGLEYLHCKATPGPVVYGNLKSSNVLLDYSLNPKLSDLRVTKGVAGKQQDDQLKSNTIPAMGMLYGYCAPDYQTATMKSDIYSFGVMMLELISGRRAIDLTRISKEQNLVAWAQLMFKDPKQYSELVDPDLHGDFVTAELQHAVATAAMCLQEDAEVRPLITDVVHALSFLGDHATYGQPANSQLQDGDPHQSNTNALKSDVSRNLTISFKFANTTSFNC